MTNQLKQQQVQAGELAIQQQEQILSGARVAPDEAKAVSESFNKLRQEPTIKTFESAKGLLSSLRENALTSERNAPMDIGLVFSFMKTLDPGSTVREGEYATAANAGSIPTNILNAYNKAVNGEFLTPKQVEEFLGAAEKSVSGFAEVAGDTARTYQKQLDNLGVDSSLLAGTDFSIPKRAQTSFDSAEAAEAAGLPIGTEITIGGRKAIIE